MSPSFFFTSARVNALREDQLCEGSHDRVFEYVALDAAARCHSVDSKEATVCFCLELRSRSW